MPKQPSDETKMRSEEIEPSALSPTTRAAAADAPIPPFAQTGAARAPAPMRKRSGGGLLVLILAMIAAIAAAVWYFFFR